MFDIDKWKEIWATITRNKTRSILTAFGVSWGLFMFILLVGFGNGFRQGIMDTFQGFAANSCFFYTNRTGEAYKGHRKGRSWEMNSKDLRLIREKAKSVEYLSPTLFADGSTVRGNKKGSYSACGVYPDQFNIQKMEVQYGRLINDIDILERRKVCFIGQEVYETLFNVGEIPTGQSIRVGGIYYQVVGVGTPVSRNVNVGSYPPKTVYIPFSTLQQTGRRGDEFDFLGCTAKPEYRASMVVEEVKEIVKANHDISPTDDKAMGSFNIEEEFRKINNLFSGINVLIWIVGMGALLSGIIGISNIMLVTVRERMREIGVRRAIGAKPITILTQILSESLVLTTLAGIAGFVFGVAILTLFQQIMSNNPSDGSGLTIIPFVSFNLALVAMAILIISSLLAGMMPALRALKIKAIDAIRDE
ncbi:MAG: ABC transporter permease [Prevotellaceae bacterium]|jgi:putative ABC transport system permease protein|nr:ABC transporter permease [Prevotellaceae bacterium]